MKTDKLIFDNKASVRTIDDNGYLHVALTPISKATVNPYYGAEIAGCEELGLNPDTIYYGLRDPHELELAAPSFNGLPVLMDHHDVDAENPKKEFTVGSTGTDAVFDGVYLKNSLSITDAEAIRAIEDGTAKEISCAYRFRPDFTAGEFEMPNGEKIHYDFVMRDISGNHVALVAEGRAGHDVKVADSKPQIKTKRSEKTLNKRVKGFKQRRLALVGDANLEIEAAEVNKAGFLKAVNVIEAQVEGYDPREVGLDIDANATVDEIIDKFIPGLGDEEKAAYKAVLEKLKGADVVDEEPAKEPEPATDTETEVPAKDDDFDERFKDPAFKAGFEEGVKYGEKREKADPERIDRDHERTGEERYLRSIGEDSLKKLKAKIVGETKEHYRALNVAANKVKPIVGTIQDPLAFDSAEKIYAFALKQKGIEVSKYPETAYAGMVDAVLMNQPEMPMANDSFSRGSIGDDMAKIFSRLDDIE